MNSRREQKPLSSAKDFLAAAELVTDPTTKAALVFLSSKALQQTALKLTPSASTDSDANERPGAGPEKGGEFRNGRLYTGPAAPIPPDYQSLPVATPVSDTAAIRDILALEARLSDLGSLSLPFALTATDGGMNASGMGMGGGMTNRSLILASFISTKQLVAAAASSSAPASASSASARKSAVAAAPPAAARLHAQVPRSTTTGGGDAGVPPPSAATQSFLGSMPSALGESYMFLSKAQAEAQAQAQMQQALQQQNQQRMQQQLAGSSGKSFQSSRQSSLASNAGSDAGAMAAAHLGSATGVGNSHSSGISAAAVDNLLAGMQRLEKENHALVRRVNDLLELERASALKQKEVDAFKAEFSVKYGKLKDVLAAFAKKYPHISNPVTAANAELEEESSRPGVRDSSSGGSASSSSVTSSASGLAPQQQNVVIKQLEQALRAALSRLKKTQKSLQEREKLIASYEQQGHLRRHSSSSSSATASSSAPASASTAGAASYSSHQSSRHPHLHQTSQQHGSAGPQQFPYREYQQVQQQFQERHSSSRGAPGGSDACDASDSIGAFVADPCEGGRDPRGAQQQQQQQRYYHAPTSSATSSSGSVSASGTGARKHPSTVTFEASLQR